MILKGIVNEAEPVEEPAAVDSDSAPEEEL